MDKATNQQPVQNDQKAYRDYFGNIDELYLINYCYNPDIPEKNGYIIFIDEEYDIDFIDYGKEDDSPEKNRAVAKLQMAEAVPTKHLPKNVRLEFKRILGTGYIHALNGSYDDIQEIISKAEEYLKKRNREFSRCLFLGSGMPAAIIAFIIGWRMYFCHTKSAEYVNPWYFGIVFGVLGAFVSIWSRYGKINNTGIGGFWLHALECYCRIMIGIIFALIAMVLIKCRLILPGLQESDELMAFILASFIAAFSERFIPSIIEKITSDEDNNK